MSARLNLLLIVLVLTAGQAALLSAEDIPPESELYLINPEPNATDVIAAADDPQIVRIAEMIQSDPDTGVNLVVVTHGWFEYTNWNRQMARAFKSKVDSTKWLCAAYEWRGQARRINPVDAAKAARKTTGPLLGEKIVALPIKFKHVHLIGHSAGSWVISEAAAVIAEKTDTQLHLTFLDAYIPPLWDEQDLARVASDPDNHCWADHYMTRDFTLGATQELLPHAHNVDLTKIDPGINDHRLPHYWYHATIIGKYAEDQKYAGKTLYYTVGDIDYGFLRSLEAGQENYELSRTLPLGNKPVRILKPRQDSWFDSLGKLFKD